MRQIINILILGFLLIGCESKKTNITHQKLTKEEKEIIKAFNERHKK